MVWVAPRPSAAAAAWRQAGFEVRPGGRHGGQPTCNELVPLADGVYVELLAATRPWVRPYLRLVDRTPWSEAYWRRKAPIPRRFLRLLARRGGLCDVCFRTDDLDEVVGRGRAAGVTIPEPVRMSRIRPDGVEVAWRLAVPDDPDLPFLIQDETDPGLRIPRPHDGPTTAAAVGRIVVRVGCPEEAGRGWGVLLGADARAGAFRSGGVEVALRPAAPGARIQLELRGAPGGPLPPGVQRVAAGG